MFKIQCDPITLATETIIIVIETLMWWCLVGSFFVNFLLFMVVSAFTGYKKVCGQHGHGDAGDCL